MDNRPIGIFDSGLGGLTAVKELRKVLPNEDILYFGDTGRVPYGTRSREIIVKYASQDMNFLMKHHVKAVVAACGTVSSTAKEIGEGLGVPYIDVLAPTAQAAVEESRNKKIGVIATSATIASGSFVKAIKSIDEGVAIYTKACPLFVPLVENGFIEKDNKVTKMVAEQYLADIRVSGADTLILGCTHYPIIAELISGVMGGVKLIDSGRETARHLALVLKNENLLNAQAHTPKVKYFVSDTVEAFKSVAGIFLGGSSGIMDVERIDIEKY